MNEFLRLLPLLVGVGSTIYGGITANRAANAQSDALARSSDIAAQTAAQQLALYRDIFNQQRADTAPWRAAGTQALGTLTGSLQGPLEETPGYRFRFNEGLRALDHSAAARGMLLSGAQIKAAQRYGQGLAQDVYGDRMNRLQAMAGLGQTATGQNLASAQQYGAATGGALGTLGSNLGTIAAAQGQVAAGGMNATAGRSCHDGDAAGDAASPAGAARRRPAAVGAVGRGAGAGVAGGRGGCLRGRGRGEAPDGRRARRAARARHQAPRAVP